MVQCVKSLCWCRVHLINVCNFDVSRKPDSPCTGSAIALMEVHCRFSKWKEGIYEHTEENIGDMWWSNKRPRDDQDPQERPRWQNILICNSRHTVSSGNTSVAVPPPNTKIWFSNEASSCRYLNKNRTYTHYNNVSFTELYLLVITSYTATCDNTYMYMYTYMSSAVEIRHIHTHTATHTITACNPYRVSNEIIMCD